MFGRSQLSFNPEVPCLNPNVPYKDPGVPCLGPKVPYKDPEHSCFNNGVPFLSPKGSSFSTKKNCMTNISALIAFIRQEILLS